MNVNEFLGFYFQGVNNPDVPQVVAIGGDRGNNTSWVARPWRPDRLVEPVGRLYFCISSVQPPANPRANRVPKGRHDLVKTYVIGLDDIRDGAYADKEGGDATRIPLQPTTILETSSGNQQWLYRLRYPADPTRAAALIEGIAAAGLTDKGAKRADRYLRVPASLNTKHDPPFATRVVEHHPERAWSLAELEVALGVTANEPRSRVEEALLLGPGEVDPLWDLVQARPGLVRGAPDARGWVPLVCFNNEQHSPGKGAEGGTHYLPQAGGGVFKCLHGHCAGLGSPELRDWLFGQDVPDLAALGAAIAEASRAAALEGPAAGEESVRFQAAPPAAPDDEAMRRRMIEAYVHVEVQNKYWSVASGGLVERASVDDRMTAEMKRTTLLEVFSEATGKRLKDMAVSAWLRQQRDLRRVANLTHRLGQPLIVDDCVNIAPPIPERIEVPGDPEPWLDLVDFVCGEQAERVLDWMAMTVTAWSEKPGWHVILKGSAHGTGKALMFSPLSRYLRPRHWYGLKPADLGDKFTFFLERRLLILDELKRTTRGEITTSDIYNTIKAWTARGTGMVIIEKKGMQPYEALDLSCWAIFSNQDVPLPIEEGDRRFLVINVPEPRPESYYKAIITWLEEGGWRMVVSWLHWRWDTMSEAEREALRGRAPMTDAKADLIDNSLEGLDGAVRSYIRGIGCEPWHDLMTMNEVNLALRSSEKLSDHYRTRLLNDQTIARALRNAGAVQLFKGQQVKDGDSKMRLWCVRGSLQKQYEALGMGKMVFDAYRSMRAAIDGAGAPNVVKFPLKG